MKTKFKARLKLVYIVPYAFFGTAVIFVAAMVGGKDPLAALAALLIIGTLVYGYGRAPFLIKINGNILTTYGLTGRRRVRLDKLQSAHSTWAFNTVGSRGANFDLLELTDVSGHRLCLQLGGLKEQDRLVATQLIKELLAQQNIHPGPETARLLERWLKPANFWSA